MLFFCTRIQLGPGQTLAVPGRIRVPQYANNVVSTLTIIVQRRTDNAISRRQVYIRTKSEVFSFRLLFFLFFFMNMEA